MELSHLHRYLLHAGSCTKPHIAGRGGEGEWEVAATTASEQPAGSVVTARRPKPVLSRSKEVRGGGAAATTVAG